MKHRRRWSLRSRLTVIASVAVALTAVSVCSLSWLALRQSVLNQLDSELQTIALGPVTRLDPRTLEQTANTPLSDPGELYIQLLLADGKQYAPPAQQVRLPVSTQDRSVLTGAISHVNYTSEVGNGRFRVLTVRGEGGAAVQLARSLVDADATLNRVALLMALLAAAAVAVAAVAGRIVAATGLRPIDQLTATAAMVADTQDLRHPISVSGDDEVARLGRAFNRMLSALDGSRRAQRRLVEDVAHELRTPMTSLRTNIELLLRAGDRLPGDDREALLRDLRTQSDELGDLVTELVALGRFEAAEEPEVLLDLAAVTRSAVERAQARARTVQFHVQADPAPARGRPAALERMALNLLDNAAKFGPANGTVEVNVGTVRRGHSRHAELTVADRGPGVPRVDRGRVFERFHRAVTARNKPGSGLGLAIVQQVVHAHHGEVSVEDRPDGGALFRVRLPADA